MSGDNQSMPSAGAPHARGDVHPPAAPSSALVAITSRPALTVAVPSRPLGRWLLGLTLLIGTLTGGLLIVQRSQREAALRDLPLIDLPDLEPAMADIINEGRAAVVASPKSGQAWGRYGTILLAQDFIHESAGCYARAEQLDPYQVRWPHLRAVALENLDQDTAVACLRRVVKIRDDLVFPKLHLAEMLLARGETAEAEAQLRRAQDLDPHDPGVMLGLSRIAALHGRLDEALQLATQAASLMPNHRNAQLLLCQIHQQRGDQAAVDEQLRMLALIPEGLPKKDWADPFLDEVGKYKRGMEWTVRTAQELAMSGRGVEAISLLRRLRGPVAEDVRVLVAFGKAYLRSGDLANAAQALRQAMEKDPTFAPAHFELGNLLLVTRRLAEAAEHYTEATRLQPSLAAAYYNLGLCRRQLGNREAAIAAFQETCRWMPQNLQAHRDLAELLIEAGQTTQALQHLESANRLAPDDPETQGLMQKARAMLADVP